MAPPPLAPAQLAMLEQAAQSMPLPPPVRAAMAQLAGLPPVQQQMLFTQIMTHHQRMRQQMSTLTQPVPPAGMPMPTHAPGAPRPAGADRPPAVPAKVGKRMTGAELQLIMRHQALQLQIHDPINDDFYHHFWVVKGGNSMARFHAAKPAIISEKRMKMDDEAVGASLGLGAVMHKRPDVAVRTPRTLIAVPGPAEPTGAAPGAPPGPSPLTSMASEGGPAMSSARWALRKSVQEARETLIELRVHASSPSVMTPYGQAVRTQLLQRLHALVHHLDANAPPGSPIGPFNVGLLNAEKGRKLLAELLPLWPPPVVGSTLLSFLQQLPLCLAGQADLDDQKLADVPQLAASLASLPKLLAPEQSAALLEATIAHGEATLAAALQRSDVTALLLGVLCCNGVADKCAPALSAFYAALLPVARDIETPWALLNAILPVANANHCAVLQSSLTQMAGAAFAAPCQAAHSAFATRLLEHIAALA
eukprot:jgi/Chrpa1/15872/Chrysochromulina_OHIO_Genome00024302-RA